MQKLKLNEDQILEPQHVIIDEDDDNYDYYATPTDNDIINIKDEYTQEGNVIFLTVFKDKWTRIGASVKDNIVSIYGGYAIPDAWSNKDDRIGKKEIHNLINGEYEAVVLQHEQYDLEEVNIIICSKDYFN